GDSRGGRSSRAIHGAKGAPAPLPSVSIAVPEAGGCLLAKAGASTDPERSSNGTILAFLDAAGPTGPKVGLTTLWHLATLAPEGLGAAKAKWKDMPSNSDSSPAAASGVEAFGV
ncbi:unnamed protein product, partial [Phaeothamnion confervicola]